MQTFLRVLGYARPIGFYLPQYIILTILATIFSVINFTVLIPLLQVLFDQVSDTTAPDIGEFSLSITYFKNLFYYYLISFMSENGKVYALYFICAVVVGSVFLANVFRYLSTLILARVRVNVITNLRNQAYHAISNFDLGYFTNQKKGDIISRVTTDVQEVELSVVSTLKVIFKEPLLIIGYFVALFTMSVELTLYTLILIPISGGVISNIAKRLKKRARKSQESLGRINNTLDETISGMRIIKAFTATSYMIEKFSKEVSVYARNNYKIAAKFQLASPLSEFMGVAVLALILLIGGQMVLNNTSSLEAAEFIGFLILFSQVLNPAKAISNSFSNINRGLASAERIFSLMDTKPQIEERVDATVIGDFQTAIQFKQVSFAYQETPVLKSIDFEVRKGETIAIVGPSGGGKSTLVDLVPRFYDVSSGQVVIDGEDIRSYNIESLRALMGIVTQESILFNDTVRNNIAFGLDHIDERSMIEAAKIANAHEFIEKLEDGYDTHIGERGTKLSGGQRQRLSIARAVLKNPPILILDEATSALDSESESLVQEAIHNLMKNRTAIVIAHRLSTIQNADRIFVMKEGEIIQHGTHDELIARQGLYKKLTEMQSF